MIIVSDPSVHHYASFLQIKPVWFDQVGRTLKEKKVNKPYYLHVYCKVATKSTIIN